MRRSHPYLVAAMTLAVLVAGCGPASGTAPPAETQNAPAQTPIASTAATATGAEASAAPSTLTALPGATLPSGALKIVTLGDSLTEGQGDDAGLGYQGRLKPLIDAKRPGTTFINVGRSGWSSTDLIAGQNGQASELTQAVESHANVAFVWIGSNDLWYLYEYGPEPMTSDAEQQDLTTFDGNVTRILHELTNHGMTVYIALLDDQSKRPVVARPADPPAFPATTTADLALMSAHVKALDDIIRHEAAQYHATTVDFYDTTIFTDAATVYSDGNHPNSAGYDRIAQIWFGALGLE